MKPLQQHSLCFVPMLIYMVLKLPSKEEMDVYSFVPVLNYILLKLGANQVKQKDSFVPVLNYILLKPQI